LVKSRGPMAIRKMVGKGACRTTSGTDEKINRVLKFTPRQRSRGGRKGFGTVDEILWAGTSMAGGSKTGGRGYFYRKGDLRNRFSECLLTRKLRSTHPISPWVMSTGTNEPPTI